MSDHDSTYHTTVVTPPVENRLLTATMILQIRNLCKALELEQDLDRTLAIHIASTSSVDLSAFLVPKCYVLSTEALCGHSFLHVGVAKVIPLYGIEQTLCT